MYFLLFIQDILIIMLAKFIFLEFAVFKLVLQIIW